jgi:putative tRNA adenosine deaminase-associated protein
VAYFTAVIARSGRAWRTRDVEVDDLRTLDELAEALRAAAVGDEPVLAVIEHEDEWFALARVDGDEEPRLFVSDFAAASHSHYAEMLAPAADVDVDDDLDGDAGDADDAADGAADSDESAPTVDLEVTVQAWAGEPDVLDDLGVSGRTLRKLVEENGEDPGAVLAEIGETVGFAEMLEALR